MTDDTSMRPADFAAVLNGNGGYGNNGAWGGDWSSWIIIFLIFALTGFGGGRFGGFGGFGGGCNVPCATQADVRAAVDQQTIISKLDNQFYGIADSTYALNNTLNQNFRGLDNAICTLGYQGAQHAADISAQLASCCCETKGAIKDVNTQSVMNTNAIQQQIASCCCDIEKMNMQSRFDAQGYNCNTLQAIDKLGDRIIDYMANEKAQALRDENQALRLAASQAAQNNYLVNQLKPPMPIPAYITCNPYASYNYNTCGNSCGGCGGSF